ncbi:MAG: nucleotidyltransferase domain-containing protein [Candidatus Acidiferrales bacterium]
MAASSTHSVSPEKQLLVRCSRTRLESQAADDIRRLLALPLDWNFLLAQAGSNSVTPLLLRSISSVAPDAMPPEQLARLKNHVRAAAVRSLILAAELIRVVAELAAAGIEAIPYKGPVLAAQVYGDIGLREFEDIDLVLRQRDVAGANEVLVRLGFSPLFPPIFVPGDPASLVPGEFNYRDQQSHLTIELHTERTLRHFPAPPDLDDVARRLVPVSLSGHSIRTFGAEDTLVFLCVHGSKDFWERLVWVADVAALLASHPQIDWDRVCAFADEVRARRMLHLGLSLADQLFEVSLPDVILARVRADAVAAAVASQIEQRLLARSSPPLGAGGSFAYRRRMVPGVLAGWRYASRLATAPAADDWHSLRLPRSLAPLYVALRPFRLLRKYGAADDPPAPPL